jgi:hypothetical protein
MADQRIPEKSLKDLLNILKSAPIQPRYWNPGMPDSGPYLWDRLHHFGRQYDALAPAQQADPFASFPKERESGLAPEDPYSPSPYFERRT